MPERVRAIVVGLGDHSEPDAALAAAVEIARGSGASLHAVHAFDLPTLFTMAPGMDIVDPRGIEAYASAVQAEMEATVRRQHPDAAVASHAVLGSVETAVRETAAAVGAGVVVVGAARQGRLSHALLGTTAHRIRGSAVPVYVVRTTPHVPRRILLTTDLSEMSATAVERGLDAVQALFGPDQRELRSLLVVSYGMVPSPLPEEALDRAARRELDAFLAARGHPGDGTVRYGEAAAGIAAEAREWRADLVVLGTHARRGAQHFLLGSVAEAVLRELPCDALVVPPGLAGPGQAPPAG